MQTQRIAVVTIIVFIIIGLILILFKAVDLLGYEGQLVNRYNNISSEAVEIKGDFAIGQTFTAPENNLHQIDVLFRTYDRKNTHDITFYLKQALDSPDIVYQETFNASEISNNQWRTFEFTPISDSRDKTYFFYFSSPESGLGNAITVGGGEGDFYSQGSAYAGPIAMPVPANADLAFRTYYGLSSGQKLSLLSQRLIEDKPAIWGNLYFYIFLASLYILVLMIIFAELVKLTWNATENTSQE